MSKQTVEEIMNTFYPIEIHYIKTKDDGYYWAFIKDFGSSTCSATGDTIEETLKSLEKVKREVVTFLIEEKGETLPSPSIHPFYEACIKEI